MKSLPSNALIGGGNDAGFISLVALALLTAESEPRNKELMIRLIMNLISTNATDSADLIREDRSR